MSDTPDIWSVEEGDRFERDRGMPDVWEVVDIEEHEGFTDSVRKVTLAATEYGGDAADITVRSGSGQFENEFSEAGR